MAAQWISARLLCDLLGSVELRSPVYRDLAERLRLLVVDGRLPVGVRLPSERDLAQILGVSRSTVTAAYRSVAEAHYLRAHQGSGYFVTLPAGSTSGSHVQGAVVDRAGLISLSFASASAPPGVASAFLRSVEQLPALLGGTGYLPTGLPVLREALAHWLTGRGLPTDPDQLIVTSGALAAWNVVVRTLIGPGDRVLMESPTYPNAIDVVRRSGARPIAYPLPEDGWRADDLQQLLRQTSPRLAYLIPEFHNPTSATMADTVRESVAAALRRNRTVAVIDETLVELSLAGQPSHVPLAHFLPDALTIGSTSKAFWGGLRIGWIRAPHDLVPSLVETRAAGDLGTAAFEQLVAADLVNHPDQVLADHRLRLAQQRDHLLRELARALPDWQPNRPEGGLSLWVELPGELSTRLASTSDQHGVVVTAGPRFFPGGGGERHVRLPFTAEPEVLTAAVDRLAAASRGLRPRDAGMAPADSLRLTV